MASLAQCHEKKLITFGRIIFYILLVDAISANVMVQFGSEWYVRHFRTLSRWFPPAEGWSLYYLALVLWVGSLLYRADKLF